LFNLNVKKPEVILTTWPSEGQLRRNVDGASKGSAGMVGGDSVLRN